MRRGAGGRAATVETGARAETAALRFLEERGLDLVTRNFRCRVGELDLVMMDNGVLVMVEVRYRMRPDTVDPAVTVTVTKRRRLVRAAQRFLQLRSGFHDHVVRFDVLALSGPPEDLHYDWIRDAFTTDDAAAF